MENQIIHGDCFDYLSQFPDGSFDAIITDPPYQYLKHKLDSNYDEKVFIDLVFNLTNSFLVFFGRGESFYKINYFASLIGFEFREELIWDKGYTSTLFTSVARRHETIAIYSKNKAVLNKIFIDEIKQNSYDIDKAINNINRIISELKSLKTQEDINLFLLGVLPQRKSGLLSKHSKHSLTVNSVKNKSFVKYSRGSAAYKTIIKGGLLQSIINLKPNHYKYQHPTEKPLELIKRLIELTTKENDLILDPFAGSGTLAIACLETNRRYICIEKEKEYFDIMQSRINQWHNNKLNGTGTHNLPEGVERINQDDSGQLSLF